VNRLTKLFQQKSNRAFDQYLLARKKSPSDIPFPPFDNKEALGAHEAHEILKGELADLYWAAVEADRIDQTSKVANSAKTADLTRGKFYIALCKWAGARKYPTLADITAAVLKCESDTWAKAAELLRKEELSK
jgi:hypothetical protein